MAFADNLATLPKVDNVKKLQLYGGTHSELLEEIDNKPGQSGSVAVYYHLAVKYGALSPKAAREGLELYAEHTEDARANPGRHPNIDRLFGIIESGDFVSVRVVE
ncbi:DUF2322 family protein [Thermithiobacillus plumbiphilus]|uniref:DUF2322 family protein n=1 Tax=Thermithiobacillus plumbiphilus TaxID=1729899 RepID=A0ABU9DA40_9PROT